MNRFAFIELEKSVADCTITLSKTLYEYNGYSRKPELTVKHGATTLTKDTDYTVTYKDNTNAGTATVTVTGKGDYKGTATATFTITAKPVSRTTITLSQTSYDCDGTAKTPDVTVTDGKKTLTENTDYTVSYENNIHAGTAKITITGNGNYMGILTKNFTIEN